jgi:hypothetical protein
MAIAKGWHEILIIASIVIAGVVEAVEQALADSPNFAALFPASLHGGFWHYIPLTFLIAAGLVWLHGKLFSPKDKPRLNLVVPTIGLTFRSAWIEPYEHSPGRWYPRQIALYFSNDGEEEIHLGLGKWIKDHIGTQVGRPLRFVYFRKNPLDLWVDEATTKIVYSGNWVKISVGLDSSTPDGELKKLADGSRLGAMEIQAEIFGTPIKIRTSIVVSRGVFSGL